MAQKFRVFAILSENRAPLLATVDTYIFIPIQSCGHTHTHLKKKTKETKNDLGH